MLRRSFMIRLLKFRIADVGFAVFTPVFWLFEQSVWVQSGYRRGTHCRFPVFGHPFAVVTVDVTCLLGLIKMSRARWLDT
jgi:hypothetical protein